MKAFFLVASTFFSTAIFGANVKLECRPVGGKFCVDSGQQSQACYKDIRIEKQGNQQGFLEYRLQPTFHEIFVSPTRVNEDFNHDLFDTTKMSENVRGIRFSLEDGDVWGQLLLTSSGDYVGEITIEEDFGIIVLCTQKK